MRYRLVLSSTLYSLCKLLVPVLPVEIVPFALSFIFFVLFDLGFLPEVLLNLANLLENGRLNADKHMRCAVTIKQAILCLI